MRDTIVGWLRCNRRALAAFGVIFAMWALGFIDPVTASFGMGFVALGTGYANILATARATGSAFGTFTTAKTVINPTELVQLPPNWWYVGKKVRVTVRMAVSNIVTTPGTITFQIMMGSIVVWTSGAIQLNATAHTLLPATLVVDLRCDTIGSGTVAKLLGMGQLSGLMFTVTAAQVDGANTETVLQVPRTAPAVGTGFDSTIANILDFWTGFSISNAGNVIQVYDYTVEELN